MKTIREKILGYLVKRDRISAKAIHGFMKRGHGVPPADVDRELTAMLQDGSLGITNGNFWRRSAR